MSESMKPVVEELVVKESPRRSLRARLRRFFLRHVPLAMAGVFVLLVLAVVGVYFVASSTWFENEIRERLIAQIENATGGRAEIGSFHWRLLQLQAEADGVVIHGLEDPGEVPYAQIDRVSATVSVLGFFSPRVLLRDLEIVRPQLHLIAYRDGSTNQPQPRKIKRPGKPVIDSLFDLRASHLAVEQGMIHYDDRASRFDYQNRYAPLDFVADDVSLAVRYVPTAQNVPEIYRIEAGAADLRLERSLPRGKKPPPVHGSFAATLDLERSRAVLRDLRVTARRPGGEDHTLEVSGVVDGFTHPRWQARMTGELDMRLLDPVTGYPNAPEGMAYLNLSTEGQGDAFKISGKVHVDGGSYIGTGVSAVGVTLDALVNADEKRLQITQIVARLRQGGQIEGTVDLQPWLATAPSATVTRTDLSSEERRAKRNVLVRQAAISIPVNGKVTANFKGVELDTILDMVASRQYQRLGLDARLNGPTTTTWTYGDGNNVSVTALLGLSPSTITPLGEVPASGVIDATYVQRDGAVDLRKLELHLPASDLEVHGALGAYPVSKPSTLTIDFHSSNLGEFDATLRSLGLERSGRAGTAALPVALSGQAEFHGTWTGSLIKPQLAGNLKATKLALEMPGTSDKSGQLRSVHMDSVDVDGRYSPEQIVVDRAQLLRGKTKIDLSGTLDASAESRAGFNEDSILRMRAGGTNVDFADVAPFVDEGDTSRFPAEGEFNTQFEMNGPLSAPSASGWVEVPDGRLFGEHVTHARAQGVLANRVLKLTSGTLDEAGGAVAASGSYDFGSKRFDVEAHGEGMEIGQIGLVRDRNLDVNGKLDVSLNGSGTLDDPQMAGSATVSALTVGEQRFGGLQVQAHSANHSVNYGITTEFEGADLTLRGETQLNADYATKARLDFSGFNIGTVLAAAHFDRFRAESTLAGTVTIDGPLKRPEQLRGDAHIDQLAVTVAGVELKSDGAVHATLVKDRIQLDPLHVTGSDTDMHLQGGLSLNGARQLDLAASGSVNLKLAETLDPDLTARGVTAFKVEAHGPLQNPDMQGSVDFQNGSLALGDLPNGLSQLRGSLRFNQNRLEVQSLTAMTGGGQLSLGGFLAYEHGIYADLTVTGKGVRIRYPQGVTSSADATLQLRGSQNNLLLSGNVLITRFAASPDLDLAALAAQANTSLQAIVPPDAPSNHVRLDVHIVSSPQLNFQNAFAKLAGDMDVHLRGTVASPSLLGRVSITQGSAMIAGTRYDLQRGDITFTNPVRIEPVIDLSATARVEDYDITLGLNGTPQKLAVSYRSDPPLPETDVLSLLALGHTGNQQRLYTQQQQQSISNPTDALLGGALNATVSNRVQKLFGAGSVKVDPNYLGAFGNSTSRITVEEQLGRQVTLTYATDINTTSQQLLQAEVAINRHVSLVVARDESGVFSMVVKATRRYR